MITLYLDHQIYSYLKNRETENKDESPANKNKRILVQKLADYLSANKECYLIFYSHAHMLDLGQDKSGNTERKVFDLNYIETWAGENYLIFNKIKANAEDHATYQLRRPIDAFDFNSESYSDLANYDIRKAFDLTEIEVFMDEEQKRELQSNIDILNTTILPPIKELQNDERDGLSDQEKNFFNLFQPLLEGGNFFDIINNTVAFTNKFLADDSIYSQLRNIVRNGTENIDRYTIPEGTIETSFLRDLAEFNKSNIDKQQILREKILGYIHESFKKRNSETPSKFDIHYLGYLMLDLMGLETERKPRTTNMLHDGQHSFYGGHCDVVISEDERFRTKSKLLYDLLGLTTKVYSISEFLDQKFSFDQENIINIDDFANRLIHDLNNGMVHPKFQASPFIRKESIKPLIRYFHYFDSLHIITQFDRKYIVLRHDNATYLRVIPYKIIESICNKAYLLWGCDKHGNTKYDFAKENIEIDNRVWNGRVWEFDKWEIWLQLDSLNRFQLVIPA